MRRNYLLSLIVIGLISLSLYSTYAMFTASVETDDIVNLTASTLPTSTEVVEYERITVEKNSEKTIEFTIKNSTNKILYYGTWYEMIKPSSINDNIVVARKEESEKETLGQFNSSETAKVSLIVKNNTASNIIINLGVGYSNTNSLNLPDNRNLITDVYKEGVLANEYIESLLPNNPTTMNNDDPDHNVRYMGKNPNNYVWFNNELWRIIGVFNVKSSEDGQPEKRLKIIRNESIDKISWDNTSDYGSNDWSHSALMEVLNNGAYWNKTSGTCPNGSNDNTQNCDFSLIGIREEEKNLIGEALWNIGGTASYDSASNGLASHWYNYERGTTTYGGQPSTWIGKIGLMYPSDYGYATSGGTTTVRASCLSKELSNWSSLRDCYDNDYLYNNGEIQWTISHVSSSSSLIFDLWSGWFTSGNVSSNYARSFDHSIFPVLYLKSSVIITGGTGTSTEPYTLG